VAGTTAVDDLTSDSGGEAGATTLYDPDGNLAGGSLPDTHPGAFDGAWHGGAVKLDVQAGIQPVVQMGARQYHPGIGRFLEVDPVEGGVDNDYNHVGDPINDADLTGQGVLTQAELNWCMLTPGQCWKLNGYRSMFNAHLGTTDNDRPNARKHVVIAAFLTLRVGSRQAREITNRHEVFGCQLLYGSKPEFQDCWNNDIGLQWGLELLYLPGQWVGSTDDELMKSLDRAYSNRWFASSCGIGIEANRPFSWSCAK
jgi:RHS repeat-associated protein